MAPRIFERGLTGLFRSRWGVALVLGVLVLVIVGLGRLFGSGNDSRTPISSGSTAPVPTIAPDDEDSVISPATAVYQSRHGLAGGCRFSVRRRLGRSSKRHCQGLA